MHNSLARVLQLCKRRLVREIFIKFFGWLVRNPEMSSLTTWDFFF